MTHFQNNAWFGDSKGGPDVKWTVEETIEALTRIYNRYKEDKDMVFYKEAVSDETFTRKALYCAYEHHDSQELRDVMDKFREVHESRVASGGLKGNYKEGMTKMVLTNGHGREDKKTTENTNKEIVQPTEQELEDISTILDD